MPDSNPGGRYPDTALRPDDPTQRTNEGLFREIEHLRELLEGQTEALRSELRALKELTEAKFDANKENVQTAFKAAGEAASKQEATFKEQIAAIAETMNVQDRGRGAEIAALSKLVERGDARGSGVSAANAAFLTIAGVVVAALGAAASIFLNK